MLRYQRFMRRALFALALICTGCASQPAAPLPTATGPSPTIAAAVPIPRATTPTPKPPVVAIQPAATASSGAAQPAAGAPSAEASIYLWPTYLPAGMQPAPGESRVSSGTQAGPQGLGFYLITLNGTGQKLAIGGGDLDSALPLNGEQKPVTAGNRSGTLITSGDQRELILNVSRGKMFLYSSGLSEDELITIATSLQPIDVQVLRQLAGTG